MTIRKPFSGPPWFAGSLPPGTELFETLPGEVDAPCAWVTVWGGASSAVVAVFDEAQGVWATRRMEGSLALTGTSGFLARDGSGPKLSLWGVVADTNGAVLAGRLFPEIRTAAVRFLALAMEPGAFSPGADTAGPCILPAEELSS
ncbi:MAG: hypothetical protein JRI97_11295 [Deltaproteobacteria bacterium]|nr:hypothetical protein [Deltaproteobacteria bacterium]